MKTLVLGDIHGRTIWKDIIAKERPDKVIFLGDYVSTHDGVPADVQISNLKEILIYKDCHPNTIMLRGNHDMQHLGYSWAEASGYDPQVEKEMHKLKDEFLEKTQWIYIDGRTIFSHAGISKIWLQGQHLDLDTINDEPPSEKFGFIPDAIHYDFHGTSATQSCTWIRPQTLLDVRVEGYDQVVGHTPVQYCANVGALDKRCFNLWLCDALGQGSYLVINKGIYIENKL